jgi:hypothetical protein
VLEFVLKLAFVDHPLLGLSATVRLAQLPRVPLGCCLRDNLRNHSYRGKQLARDQAKDHELSKTCRLLVDGTKHRKRLLLDHCCLAVQYMCRIDRVKHLVVELLGAVSV